MELIKTFLKKDKLFTNSLFLIAGNIYLSATGFLFWIIAARIFPAYQIGIATSLIAIVNLISSLSLLGFNTGLMRFLPNEKDKNALINSILTLAIALTTIISLFVLLILNKISPALIFITKNYIFSSFFIIFTLFSSLNYMLESICIALRSTLQVLIKDILQGFFKLVFPIFLVSLGGFGIFSSFYAGIACGVIYGGMSLIQIHQMKYKIQFNQAMVKKLTYLSIGTYLSNLAGNAPTYILPILITHLLDPKQTAYFYIAATTANVIYLISVVISQNLLVEGAYDELRLEFHLRKATRITFAIITPMILIILLFGNLILNVFGKQYSSEGFTLLKLLAITGIVIGLSNLLSSILTIFHHITLLIVFNCISTLVLVIATFLCIRFGLIGVGFATIISESLLLVLYILSLIKMKKGVFIKYLI